MEPSLFQELLQNNIEICLSRQKLYGMHSGDEMDLFFGGILNKIYQRSQVFGNPENLNFIESEVKFIWSSIEKGCSPFNVLEYKNYDQTFKTLTAKQPGNYFGFVFFKIRVKPIAIALMSECTSKPSCLTSFAIQGYDEATETWETLEEQRNQYQLLKFSPGYGLFPINTDKYYSGFRILQTEISSKYDYSYVLSAVEIHGEIELREELTPAFA